MSDQHNRMIAQNQEGIEAVGKDKYRASVQENGAGFSAK